MNVLFSEILSPSDWLIFEREWSEERQKFYETILSLANGYVGSRAVLEEIPPDSEPGTYIAGLYDRKGSKVSELVNLPNPFYLRITLSATGERLGCGTADVSHHLRILDMKKGILFRRTVFLDYKKKRYELSSLRFLSMKNKHLGVMVSAFKPLDEDVDVIIECDVDLNVVNKGGITEGSKVHFDVHEVRKRKGVNYISVKTFEHSIVVGIPYVMFLKTKGRYRKMSHRYFELHLKKDEEVLIYKYFVIFPSHDPLVVFKKSFNILERESRKGFEKILAEHIREWEKKWKRSDVKIQGNEEIQRALRFNLYHLIACYDGKKDTSIGARALTGEGYRGHVFWETEVYILPFFIHTFPEIAKELLLYRYRRLNKARIKAQEIGCGGALYPWESADSGDEETPEWYKKEDGRVYYITTHTREHHISGDIAFGVWRYYLSTDDEEFMLRYGLEIIFETARFYATRCVYNLEKGVYEIKDVMGPDEFHDRVDNSAYTNYMAMWNLKTAVSLYNQFLRRHPSRFKNVIEKIGLREEEVKKWKEIAQKIYIPRNSEKIIEEFDGYFSKRFIPLPEAGINYIPILPPDFNLEDVEETQWVKQADVVLLFHLFPLDFSEEEVRKNFNYYDIRTYHLSSLSSSIYSAVAARVGEEVKAEKYFLASLYTDLKNIYGNTEDGIHIGNAGGVWQALIFGFCGLTFGEDGIMIQPRFCSLWKEIEFRLFYKRNFLKFNLRADRVKVICYKEGKRLKVEAFGKFDWIKKGKIELRP